MVVRNSGEEQFAASPLGPVIYAVSEEDANGIQFKCVDSVHTYPKWTGGNNEIMSEMFFPICKCWLTQTTIFTV